MDIETKFFNTKELPLVIEPKRETPFPEFLHLLENQNDFFKQNLLKYGGLLFRNFPVESPEDFAAVIRSLKLGNFVNYIGGDTPRTKVIDGLYTSTEVPPSCKIPLHNELSYSKNFPKHIYFYCDIAPNGKGQTTISDARKIYQDIDQKVKERFTKKQLLYISRYPYKNNLLKKFGHKSWINVFETEDKSEVERKCEENGLSYIWNKNDWLQISQVRPSVLLHPETQETVWFNQAHHYDFNPKFLGFWNYIATKVIYCRRHTLLHEVYFADQTKIPRKDMYHILDVLEENSIYFPWQKGDVLVLDNILAMHGRAPFSGKRRIITAMTS